MSYGMGLQVSCGVDSEVPEKGALRKAQEGDRAHHQGAGATEGERGAGGETGSGPRPRVALGSPKVCRCPGGRLYQREERDLHSPDERQETQLRRSELLGQRLLRIDHRVGRASHTSVHPSPGRDRSKARPDETV